MYNLRYHIASLVAVFLALALGLVLGGIVVERGTLDAQRMAIVNSLRKDFRKLSTENKNLQEQLALQSGFARAAQADFSKDRLKGKRVLLVMNSGRADAAKPARRALEQAGATVSVVTIAKAGFGLNTDAVKSALESRLASGTPIESGSIVASLAAEWTSGTAERPVTDALLESGAITIEDLAAGDVLDGMTITAVFDGKPDGGALELGKALQALQKPVVAAESLSQATGVAAAGSELGLGAVNAVDTAAGGWALVDMMGGGKLAFYGTGPDVEAAFPPLPAIPAAETTGTAATTKP